MWHVGIDLHRQTLVIAAVNDAGACLAPRRIDCRDRDAIVTVATAEWARGFIARGVFRRA
jgi:hypothetical protein